MIKTLSLPLVAALVAATAAPASAQLSLELSTQKVYRQDKKGITFTGGRFDVALDDGRVATIGICNDPDYYPPGTYIGICSPGTSGFLSSGTINGATVQRPYLLVTYLNDAIAIEPREPGLISLTSAPASLLPRPSGGFADASASVYFDLTSTNIREYILTSYSNGRTYAASERGKFEKEIVPGAYRYSFPRLGRPLLPAPITAVVYPMVEGQARLNNKKSGFIFTSVNKGKWNKGFAELSFRNPNKIKWTGLSPSVVFAAVDDLYFSIRALQDPENPKSGPIRGVTSIFPAFTNLSEDPRILLGNPFVSNFTTPPIFPSGTVGLIEVELQRGFQTGGVTYDFSNRRFQIPVAVIDRFSEFKNQTFPNKKKTTILDDNDKDGYNNLTEWILDSNAAEATSIPRAPVPAIFIPEDIIGNPDPDGATFGFDFKLKKGTVPRVKYTLQRSINQGKTWSTFRSDDNWTVVRTKNIARGTVSHQIEVRSRKTENGLPVQPEGTASHVYRLKVTLVKKKS